MTNVALVTGVGRRAGLGAAICRKLAADGFHVVFTWWGSYDSEMPWGKDEQTVNELIRELEQNGVKAAAIEADLERPQAAVEIMKEAEAAMEQAPSVLVNNAAVSINDHLGNVTAEALDRHYAVNTRAVVLLIQAFAAMLPRGEKGSIVNIATGWSKGQMPDELSYVVTKSAAETLVYSISSQLMKRGIRLNGVNPGPTDTGWMTEEIKEELKELFPDKRIGEPEDAARAVAWLAGEEARWITGQVLHSEGGFLNRDSPGTEL
ncbi:SDR family oxidoreductase [Bacillus daqingensis]|uniref:SDR family oxidoreductase n=1 Tax=Bacillus daqingensis TaxID=872396 RepID=A0ABV9NRW5_9BACI